MDLARMRLEYETEGIDIASMLGDPMQQFELWLRSAVEGGVAEPNAMVLSTVDAAGNLSSRYVLLKGIACGGFDFYTNYGSNKSTHLEVNSATSITFGWLELHRQVNVNGRAKKISGPGSDKYWNKRTRGSQLGAVASNQSSPVTAGALAAAFAQADSDYPDKVPRPPNWGGWRVVPESIEFWQGRLNRLHDRIRYCKDGKAWNKTRLSP